MALFQQLVGAICLCHQPEHPHRALFRALDGKTSGPATFTGPIGKCIAGTDAYTTSDLCFICTTTSTKTQTTYRTPLASSSDGCARDM